MVFCDDCDRGYHSFCVGLAEVPSGKNLMVACVCVFHEHNVVRWYNTKLVYYVVNIGSRFPILSRQLAVPAVW